MTRTLFGIEFVDILKVPKVGFLQTVSVFQFTLTFLYIGLIATGAFILLLFSRFAFVPVLYLVWFVYDFRTPDRGGRRWNWIRNWKLWEYFRDYFPVRLVKTADLDPSKNYMFLCHPHGIMSYGAFLCFCTGAAHFEQTFPGMRSTVVSLSNNFLVPFSRDYLMSLGLCSCNRTSIEWLLSNEGTGNAVVLVVGGASEALEARPDSFTLTLANRKGFSRIALKQGVELVPVFSFGENDLYTQLPNPPGSLLRKFQLLMTRLLSFSPPVFHGRGYSILPYRKPINVVVGSPLEVSRIAEPTNEQVNELHAKYIKHLTDHFESYKAKYGVSETQRLSII